MTTIISRRAFCLSTAALTGTAFITPLRLLAMVPLQTQQPATDFEVMKLREGIHAIIGGGGNALAIASTDGGLLIDTKMPPVVDLLHTSSVDLLGGPPAIIINTHHHGDHTGGNYRFSDHASIIGHKNIQPRLQENIDGWIRQALLRMVREAETQGDAARAAELRELAKSISIEQFKADVEFADEHTLEHGGRKISLTHVTPGHTDNDAIVFLPNENVLHAGDLLFNGIHPFMDVSAKANSTGWRESLRRAIAMCDKDTIVVPGHGQITDRDGLTKQIHYFEVVEATVRNAVASGKDRDAVAALTIDEFATYAGNRMGTNLGIVFDEVTGATR
ncbi:MAG: MBL fold metallo-hydrolase [Phycisphaerales bacterium]